MAVLDQLEPQSVFRFFEELSAIPRGSGNTGAISDWCVAFARERGLEVHQDELHNVIIIKEATPGHEAAEPLILQGHLDMVCEKTADCAKDMSREGLDLVVDGDTVYAKGTTLGGDDGIAVAIAWHCWTMTAWSIPAWRRYSPRKKRWAWTACGGWTSPR